MSIQAGLKERAYSIAEMARTPDQIKAAQRTLSQAVQDGSLPSYVGIPLISELNQKMAKASAPAAPMAPQQPPIAQQVMQQAQADQGVPALPSGLPTEMAGGGIVAFAGGGDIDRGMVEALLGRDEDESDEDYDELVSAISGGSRMPDISNILKMVEESNLPSDEGIESLSPVESKTYLTRSPEGAAVENVTRREGDGTVQIERDKKAVSGMDGLLKYVLAKESGGRRYDKAGNLLTSPKGAQGEMQVMPGTQMDPGFGVEPARDRSPDEIARVGRDYLKALRNRYGDDKLAAIAYNMGPGATDKWLAAGADPSRLPAETRNYVAGMASGGIASVKHFQNAGIVTLDPSDPDSWKNRALPPEPDATDARQKYRDITKMTPEEIRDQARRNAAARRLSAAMPPAAASAASAAAEAAPAVGKSYQSLSSPTYGQRLLAPAGAAAFSAPGAFVGAGGTGLSALSANYLNRLPDESLQYLGGAMDDTGLAANILLQSREDERKGITTPKPSAATPAATPAAVPPKKTTLPTTGAGAGRGTQGGMSFGDLAQQAREEEFAKNQEASDLEEGRFMERMAKATAEEGKKEAEDKEEPKSKLEQLLERRMGNLEKQKDIDNYMALLSAGLGMMGGTSPYAGANIGQGAQAGIASYLRSGATRAAEENAILSGQLGLERYKGLADIRKQGIESQKALKEMELGLRGKIAEGQDRQRADALATKQQQLYQSRLKQIEDLAKNQALAQYKGEMIGDKRDQIFAQAINDLRSDPGYRDLYKRVHGFDPMPAKSGNTISWGQLTQ
jgi:hypothetical protein